MSTVVYITRIRRAMGDGDVFMPRFRLTLTNASLERCISLAVQQLGYEQATQEQREAMKNFVLGKDVFVSLPTGSGKTLCYAALPVVFDRIRELPPNTAQLSIVVCVSPLSALMLGQVMALNRRGLQATHVGMAQKDVNVKKDVERGRYQLVLLSPESLLLNLAWREMFRSCVYRENLAGLVIDEAHLVEKW